MQMVADMRGVGVKYGGNYADVLYGRPLTTYIQGLLVILVYVVLAIVYSELYYMDFIDDLFGGIQQLRRQNFAIF